VRKFLSGMLSKHDYEVEVAKNGTAAMELLNQKEFDMMISDLEMPQISGYELIEQIRSDSRWEKLPIIVLTGRASKHIEQHITQLGANEFVVKPFKESDLLEKIGRYIEFKR
jgi:chemosensory pili system protein ChpA (sensor histidine kinase/response regulator)